MTWVNLSSAFGYGTKLTSVQMQQLRDNIAAAFNKDSGAPVLKNGYVVEAMYAAGSVGRNALKTATGSTSGNLGPEDYLDVNLQAYQFAKNIHGQDGLIRWRPATYASATYIDRHRLYNESSTNFKAYSIYYRYITSTDEPFIFALIDKKTGAIDHVWMADDPPEGYWGLDEAPEDFEWPVLPKNPDDFDAVALFKTERALIEEIQDRAKADGQVLIDAMNAYEYDDGRRLFVPKNLRQI